MTQAKHPTGTRITGRLIVEDAQGKTGLPGQPVELIHESDPNQTQTCRTDQDGRFEFLSVGPGVWRIQLPEETPGTATDPPARIQDKRLTEIRLDVPPHRQTDLNLGEIGYERDGGSIQGTVFYNRDGTNDPNANPRIPGVQVALVNLATRTSIETKTDGQGRYHFANPEPGTYILEFDPRPSGASVGLGKNALQPPPSPGAFHFTRGQKHEQHCGYEAQGGVVHGMVFLDADGSQQRSGAEPGLKGVSVVLASLDGEPVYETESKQDGGYWFNSVKPGQYVLRFSPVVHVDDQEYILTTDAEQFITARAGTTVQAAPTGYQLELHEIRGRVIYEDGQAIPGVVVTLDDGSGQQETAVTDQHGRYIFHDRRGKFTLTFADSPHEGELLTPRQRPVEVNSVAEVPDTVYRSNGGGGGGGSYAETGASSRQQESLADIASYMPTSQEVGDGPSFSSSSSGQSGPGYLQRIVDSTMQAMFGRTVQVDDGKAALDALNRSFVVTREHGKKVIEWQPRMYVVQTELGGAITGAQASLYRRAKSALDDALPLLEGLQPLSTTADEEEIQAARAIVHTEMTELVNELGLESGPRPRRIDSIFDLLEQQLSRFPEIFGLDQAEIITVDEEQQLTDFLVIQDHVRGLRATWEQFREQFRDTKFLGTQLVLLERTLSAVAESVGESYRAMDSVFLGPAERQTVRIPFTDPINGEVPAPMFVEELMSWVDRFAQLESPVLIREGGRRGVETVATIADELYQLVAAAAEADVPHVGFSRERVRRSLRELASQIRQVYDLARELLQDNARSNR